MIRDHLIVGTRGSKMALVQTSAVIRALQDLYPRLNFETRVVSVKGDRDKVTPIPLDTVGKEWFSKDIEVELSNGGIDFAVHSFKDLAPAPPEGLEFMPALVRDDVRDVLISRVADQKLRDLRSGAVVGTDSLRRKANLLRLRPDLEVKPIRGNADTRIQKLYDEDYDAIVLAAAGLERLSLLDIVSEWFDPAEFVPAVGQGSLAIEYRTKDADIRQMVMSLCDAKSADGIAAEQAFVDVVGGGCKLPVGCFVSFENDEAVVYGMLGTDDARKSVVRSVRGPATAAINVAKNLAAELRQALGQS